MPFFKYVGPFDEVDVAGQSVARGVVAEFAADVAAGLVGQESWEPIPRSASRSPQRQGARRASGRSRTPLRMRPDEQPEKTTKKAAPTRADDSQEG